MQPGAVIADRFEIERLVGTGGMGRVFLARDLRAGAPVALKVLGVQATDEARFAREARVLAELRHPGVVRYVTHGTTQAGEQYLVMEWLEGPTLANRLREGRLTIGESVATARAIAEPLGAVHERGIVHRDVKPSNVILTAQRLKVVDFGLARPRAPAELLTASNAVLGTPGYMAPEQSTGALDVDARADVFALGCVLYRCLTGRPPFVGDDVLAILLKTLMEDPPPARALRSLVPRDLDALVTRMLSKDPSSRPSDGSAVARELDALGELPIEVGAEPMPDPSSSPQTVRRTPALSATERRVVCMVLTRPHDPAASAEALRGAGEVFGARVDSLLDGTTVLTITSGGVATDQVDRAARCALAIREGLHDAPITVATGRAEPSSSGTVGDAIDRGAALLARGGPLIRIDETTARLLDARFSVGGDKEGACLLGASDLAEQARRLLGAPTPCVGREQELAALEAMFAQCAAEPVARAVLVTAAAGVGKSRLRIELVRGIAARHPAARIWIARADSLRAGSPFGLVVQLVRKAAAMLEGEPLSMRHEKLAARVASHVPSGQRRRVTEFLAELVGAPFDATDAVELRAARQDPILMGDQMRRAWLDFLAAECAERPVMLILEDLHWGDAPSLKLIDSALRELHDRPLMVLALARPEIHDLFPKLWAGRRMQELRLEELTPRASERLVRAALGASIVTEAVARLTTIAAGNAFFLEELIRAAAHGEIDGLPASVLAMLDTRLAALDIEARRVLRAASIYGEVFWTDAVAALLGVERATIRIEQTLRDLVEAEVIDRRAQAKFPQREEYTFRHALVRESAYAMLTDADRRLGHRLAGGWLEAAGENDAFVLAEHFVLGAEPVRALEWYQRAAQQSLEGNDFPAAIERAERGLACGGSGERRGALLLIQAIAFAWSGDHDECAARAREAASLFEQGSERWFHAMGHVAIASGRTGARAALIAAAESIRAARAVLDARAAQAVALCRASLPLFNIGRQAVAEAMLEQAEALLSAADRHDPSALGHLRESQGQGAEHRGDVEAFVVHLEAALVEYERAGNRREAASCLATLGWALVEIGDCAAAERFVERAIEEAERIGARAPATWARVSMAVIRSFEGRLDVAWEMGHDVLRALLDQGNKRFAGIAHCHLSRVASLRGDPEAAAREAIAALSLFGDTGPLYAIALGLRARALLALGRTREALDDVSRAMGHVEGAPPQSESLVRCVYAEALRASGDREGARAAIASARESVLARAARIGRPDWRASFLALADNARTLELDREYNGAGP